MGRAEVGGQDDAGFAVEREHGRRPAAGGGAAADLVDEALLEQRLDPLGDGRAREPGHSREVGAGDGDPLADQPQQRARAGRATTERSERVRHHCDEKYKHELDEDGGGSFA